MVEAGGGTPEGAAAAAERLIARGVTGLVSFGLAGGLNPAVRPGAVIVPETVLAGGAVFHADAALAARFGGFAGGPLLAGTKIVASAADKARMHAATGADAVDLESGAVARAGLPFAVVRAICDPAERTLPPAAMIPLRRGGGVDLGRILLSVARRPGQIPGLIGLGRDAAVARQALIRLTGL